MMYICGTSKSRWILSSAVKGGFVSSKATATFPYRCCILESLTNFHVAAATFVKVATASRLPSQANWLFVDPINSLAQRWSSWDKVKLLLLWKWEGELIHDIFSFSPTFDEIPLAIHLASSLYVSEPQKSQSLWGLLHASGYCKRRSSTIGSHKTPPDRWLYGIGDARHFRVILYVHTCLVNGK